MHNVCAIALNLQNLLVSS